MEYRETEAGQSQAKLLMAFEQQIQAHLTDRDFKPARDHLRAYLWAEAGEQDAGSIAEAIDHLARSGRHLPHVAAILVRAAALGDLLPAGTAGFDRNIISLTLGSLPKVAEFVGIDPKAQTFENVPRLRDAHQKITDILSPLSPEFHTVDGLIASRQSIMGALRHGCIRAYGDVFCLDAIRNIIETTINSAQQVSRAQSTFLIDVHKCQQAINEGLAAQDEVGSFLYYDYLHPFLRSAERALGNFIDSTRSRFAAKVVPLFADGDSLPKRYPLHEPGRELQIRVPLRNQGPGLAVDVRAEILVDSSTVILQNPFVVLGDVAAGDFALTFDAMVVEPSAGFYAEIEISWSEVGSAARDSDIFGFKIGQQPTDIDWPTLEYWHPYSTSAAEGVRFIGRAEMVKDLSGRLLRDPMEPFYITGQKRVGKTSLALAVARFAQDNAIGKTYHFANILWGHIAHADARASLAALGREIERLIADQLPSDFALPECVFDGSLAPLMKLAELAWKVVPEHRFLIIIDEFDEINQELYLQGSLAETLFANLRALSTTKNVCMVLVGGENMPFIMERQGEKLNKFTRKNLSYFSRSDEWEDFKELVRRPSENIVRWHDDAISVVFNSTNGNPYFTNLLCSRVLRDAIRLRDSDVTADEVLSALEVELGSLDANSFAHLWHDGVFKPPAEREPDILRRRRVLVALARCSRKLIPLTSANLSENKGFSGLSDGEIGPTLNDFRRRGVLSEDDGVYRFNLPIFERWLAQDGLSVVQPDAVSEELASVVQAEEDAAFVRSEEVAAVVRSWPTYQGRHASADDVRAWYQQVEGFREQRLLFTILKNLRFLGESELREKSRSAYMQLRKQLSEFVMKSLADRRQDILVTYLDGHGKSGEYYASLFCEENKISVINICSRSELSGRLIDAKNSGRNISAVLVVDDIAATGRTLADSVSALVSDCGDLLKEKRTKLLICALYATRQGVDSILRRIATLGVSDVDFRAGEVLGSRAMAFAADNKIWASADEMERARALCVDLGARINRTQPLGYGGIGLLLVFPNTVPNNTLPIIHSQSKASAKSWQPLFRRPTN